MSDELKLSSSATSEGRSSEPRAGCSPFSRSMMRGRLRALVAQRRKPEGGTRRRGSTLSSMGDGAIQAQGLLSAIHRQLKREARAVAGTRRPDVQVALAIVGKVASSRLVEQKRIEVDRDRDSSISTTSGMAEVPERRSARQVYASDDVDAFLLEQRQRRAERAAAD